MDRPVRGAARVGGRSSSPASASTRGRVQRRRPRRRRSRRGRSRSPSAAAAVASPARRRPSLAWRATRGAADDARPRGRIHFFADAALLSNTFFIVDDPARRDRGRPPRRPCTPGMRAARSQRARARARARRRGARAAARPAHELYADELLALPRHAPAPATPTTGPPLRGVGALAADFYLRTGYMPLAHPGRAAAPQRRRASPSAQLRALIALRRLARPRPAGPAAASASAAPSPRACASSPTTAPAATRSRRTAATSPARVAPALDDATPTQIAEAVRIGPYLMPRFSERAISDRQLDSIVAYVRYARDPEDPGGWPLGRLGPVPEGMVAWLLAGAVLVGCCLVIGRRLRAMTQARALARRGRSCCSRGKRHAATPSGAASAAHRPARRARPPRRERGCSRCSGSPTLAALGFVVVYALDPVSHRTQLLGLTLGARARLARGRADRRRPSGSSSPRSWRRRTPSPTPRPSRSDRGRSSPRAAAGSRAGGLLALGGVAAGGTLGARAGRAGCCRSARCSTPARSTRRRGAAAAASSTRPAARSRADDDRGGRLLHGVPRGRRPRAARRAARRRPPRPASSTCPTAARTGRPSGIVAYSKICTHAGCAVALYRKPTFPEAEPKPALVCPCHYSTFDPATGGTVLSGPAGRPLPQLPLERRRRRRTSAPRATSAARSARRGGACART